MALPRQCGVARQNLDREVRARLEGHQQRSITSDSARGHVSQAIAAGQAINEADLFSPATKAYAKLVSG